MPTQMFFRHDRHQHAVGHGFFHTGSLRPSSGPSFNYVYDCGAKKKSKLLAPAVAAYRDSLGDGPVDLLVISHFHADHANGLDTLLRDKKVAAAVIPYVSPAERLLLVAETLATAGTGFDEVVFASNPAEWLRARGVSAVVTISRSSTRPPPDDRPADPAPADPPAAVGWQLRVGKEDGLIVGDRTEVGHTDPLVLTHNRLGLWEFLFYCWNADLQAEVFSAAIGKRTGKTPEDLLAPVALGDTLRDRTTRNHVLRCYADIVGKGFNWTTLCLRAGPLNSFNQRIYFARSGHSPGRVLLDGSHEWVNGTPISWLGTGDLELSDPDVEDEFYKHYRAAGPVRTLSLPHHGSEKNFAGGLLQEFKPSLVFATCPSTSPHHPSEAVVRSVNAFGSLFEKVDESAATELHESAGLWIAR